MWWLWRILLALIIRCGEVMMAAVAVADSSVEVDGPSAVRERLEAFGVEVLAGAVNRPVQLVNGGVYLRGLIEQGPRKSLEPMVARLGSEADYESLQNFLAVRRRRMRGR